MPDTLSHRFGLLSALLGTTSLALLAVAVWRFRAGGWPWPQAYDLAGWAVWVAIGGTVIALAGLVAFARRIETFL